MKERRHVILDHPILGYFLLLLYVSIVSELFNILDALICSKIPGLTAGTITYGFFTPLGAVLAALLFTWWFRPDYKGCFSKDGILAGLLMILPMLVLHYVGSIVSWITYGTASVIIAMIRALSPGFLEEITFRGLGVANYMRTIKDENKIPVIFWLSAIVFGSAHLGNLLVGGDLFSVCVQTVYAVGIGVALGAVYLRTGNLVPCIIAHWSVDCMEFIRADINASGGIMMYMGLGDWITVAAGVVGVVCGLRAMNKKYYPDIMRVWDDKWNRTQPVDDAADAQPEVDAQLGVDAQPAADVQPADDVQPGVDAADTK